MSTWDFDADMRRQTTRMAVREFLVLGAFLGSLFGLLVMAYGLMG